MTTGHGCGGGGVVVIVAVDKGRSANPEMATPVSMAIKPVRKPVRNLRPKFQGTITQISINNETLNCRKQVSYFYDV